MSEFRLLFVQRTVLEYVKEGDVTAYKFPERVRYQRRTDLYFWDVPRKWWHSLLNMGLIDITWDDGSVVLTEAGHAALT